MTSQSTAEAFLTLQQACAALGITERTARRRLKAKTLVADHRTELGHLRFKAQEIQPEGDEAA